MENEKYITLIIKYLNYLKETGIAQKRSIISLSDSWKDDLQFYLQITSEGVALVATLLFSQIS